MAEQKIDYKSFAEALKRLSEDDNVKIFSTLVETEIPNLKRQLYQKEKELEEYRKSFEDSEKEKTSEYALLTSTFHKVTTDLEEAKKKLNQKNTNLEEKIRKQDELVNTAKKQEVELNGQLEKLRESLDSERKRLTEANSIITQLKKSLEERKTEVEGLKKVTQQDGSKIRILESQIAETQKDNSILKTELNSTQESLNVLKGYAKELEKTSDKSWLSPLEEIWETARELCQNLFKDDLSNDILDDHHAWKGLAGYPYLQQIPLPRSNTPAAKNMRTVAILAILAREIHNEIFLSTYILDNGNGRELEIVLRQLAKKNGNKEAFLRAILQSSESDCQLARISKKAPYVARRVVSSVHDMIPLGKCTELESKLRSIIQIAIIQWQKVQVTKIRHETSFALGEEDYDDKNIKSIQLMFPDKESKSQSDSDAKSEKILVIFPRVNSYEDGVLEPISNATYMMQSQVNAAKEEISKQYRLPEERKKGEKKTGPSIEWAKQKVIGPRRNTVPSNGNFLSEATISGKPGKR